MAVERIINVKIKDNAKAAIKNIKQGFEGARKAAKTVEKQTRGIRKAAGVATRGVKLLGKGFKAMGRVAKAAVAATGIGALFVIIQSIVTENQKIVDIFNIFGKVAGKVVSDLIGKLTEIAASPKEFANNIKEFVMKQFQRLFDSVGHLGKAIGKLFRGDFAGAMDEAKAAGEDLFSLVTGGITKEDIAGIKSYAEETIKVAVAAVEAEKSLKLLRAESDARKEALEGEMEAQRAIRDDATRSIAERLEANAKLQEQAKAFSEEREALAKAEVEAAKAALLIDKDNVDAKVALIEAEKQLSTVKKESAALNKDNQIQENALLAEAQAIKQSELETQNEVNKVIQDGEIARMMHIGDRLRAQKDALDSQYALDLAAADNLIASLEVGTTAHQEALNQRALLDANYKNATADVEQEITNNNRIEQEKRLQMATATIGGVSALINAFGIQDEKKKRKLFMVTKALNLSQAAMDTYGGVTAALKDTKGLTGFERWGNALAVGVAGAANMAKIASTRFGGTAGNGATDAPRPQSLSAPSSGVFTGGDGINQLLQAGQDTPIKAYVVSSEVTTQQELDRKRNSKASF